MTPKAANMERQPKAEEAAEDGTQGIAAHHDADAQVAPPRRHVFRDHGGEAGEHTAYAQAGDDAQDDELVEGIHQGRQRRPRGDHEHAQQQHVAAADAVGEGGQEHGAQGHADEAGAEYRSHGAGGQGPLISHGRRGEGHRQYVYAVQHVEDETDGDHGDLDARDRRRIDHFTRIHAAVPPG
jgi:hypothetical protein